MAVNLSPVGGVAAQFFTNSGTPLTGGKIFTYAAGTTTPQATYTSSVGNVPWTNPIVLDAAGRVPSGGEIWLTDGLTYKFLLKDANDVLIATYDNISGINSNFIAFTNQQEIVTATAGQTVFNLGINYQPGTNSLSVFVDGVNQYGPGAQYAYVETDSNTVTFTTGLHVGAEVKFTTTQQQGAGAVDASQVSYDPPFTGSVPTNVEAKLAQTISVKDFGAVGDGVTDDTTAIQAAFDSIGAITAGDFQDVTPAGVTLHFPAGRYLVTSTLFMPSNVRMQGTGMGTQFKFDPTAPNSNFLERKNNNVGGSALNRSNFSMHFENFYVFVAYDGGSTTGRNGSPIPTVNTNTADCFNLLDCTISSFTNVTVTDFWYGTAFNIRLGSLFAFYNYMLGCYTRDCQLGVKTTSASNLTDCYFGHGVAFPPPTIQANVQYAVSFDGARGCAMQGGSIECSCSVALIKQNNAGHTFTGVYMEAFGSTPAMMDASSLATDTGNLLLGGNSYGFTNNVLYNENITRAGSFNMTLGAAFNFGDCSEIEIADSSTRQSPSFREGLPGRGHFPAGGTLTISTDSFIDDTSMALTRGAGTGATDNQMSYNLVVRNSEKVLTNVWLTCLVKLEGGENNFTIRTFDATNGNAFFKKQMTFNNGWQLWAAYLKRVNNSTVTFFVRQIAGSTDPSQIVKITALRVYTNGFLPIPAPYKWQEFRTVVPATGTWKRGDIVWNSQPSALGTPGWICTTAGTPGTWSAMANLV